MVIWQRVDHIENIVFGQCANHLDNIAPSRHGVANKCASNSQFELTSQQNNTSTLASKLCPDRNAGFRRVVVEVVEDDVDGAQGGSEVAPRNHRS
jgi:hypothetical protein